MKKILLLLLLTVHASLFTFSQEKKVTYFDHMLFYTFEIDGTIDEFQKKLKTIGFVPSTKPHTGPYSAGIREFVQFNDDEFIIVVFYDVKTNIVYRLKTFRNFDSEFAARGEFSSLRSFFLNGFPYSFYYDKEEDGFPTFTLMVKRYPKDVEPDLHRSVGTVSLQIYNSVAEGYPYYISEDYVDILNQEAFQKNCDDDL